MIRLHASPAPLSRTVVRGADLRPSEGGLLPPNAPATDADGTPARFLSALRGHLGAEAKTWLTGAALEPADDGWVLLLPTRFKADWVRARFSSALEHARVDAGLECAVEVRVGAPS